MNQSLISNVMAALVIVGSVVSWGFSMNQDIVENRFQIKNLSEDLERIESDIEDIQKYLFDSKGTT